MSCHSAFEVAAERDARSSLSPAKPTTTLMDLPDELWVEIFARLDTFSEIEALRNVCSRFRHVSDGISRRAFIKFESDVAAEMVAAQSRYACALAASSVPPKRPIPIFNLAHRVHALNVIGSQFALLRALVWQFARAAAVGADKSQSPAEYNLCAGDILDNYAQTLRTVRAHPASSTREEDFEILLERLRSFTSWYARFFVVLLKKRFELLVLPGELFGTAHAQDVLAGMTILAILETCKDATCVEAWINDDGARSRILVRYVVHRSWFRVDKFAFWDDRQPLARKLINLVRFVKEMVLIINHRYLQIEHRQRYKRITSHDYPADKISICGISCINKEYTYSEDCEKQTLLYRYQNPLDSEYLAEHSGIQIDVDATCFNEFIPKSLAAKCKENFPRKVDGDCSFEFGMKAYQFYNEETLAYGINRSLNRPQKYQARSRTKKKNEEEDDDDEVVEDDYDPVVNVDDWCMVQKDFSKYRDSLG